MKKEMTNAITTQPSIPPAFLALRNPNKQEEHRLRYYVDYVTLNGGKWARHDLNAYRDYLLTNGLADNTVKAHIATVRAGLRRLADDRDFLFYLTNPDDDFLTRKAWVDEITQRLDIACRQGKVDTIAESDPVDSTRRWLTPLEQLMLLHTPDRTTLVGLRDAALIGMALATGLRAAELCNLDVDDLRQTVNGELVVNVRQGKRKKQRAVPYGAERGVLRLVDYWLDCAGIATGYVFRGLRKGATIRQIRMATYTFGRQLELYTDATPHDLRRTYARNRYTQGMDIVPIRDNLGHADIRTTQGYIGALDIAARVPVQGLDYGLAD